MSDKDKPGIIKWDIWVSIRCNCGATMQILDVDDTVKCPLCGQMWRLSWSLQMAYPDGKENVDIKMKPKHSYDVKLKIKSWEKGSLKSDTQDGKEKISCVVCGRWSRSLDSFAVCGDCLPKPNTQEKILSDFKEKLLGKMEDMPPEYQKLLNDNFWKLLADGEKADKPSQGEVVDEI